MGTPQSPFKEWIELYNPNSFKVNLQGFKLQTEDKSLDLNLKGEILPKSFFLLERNSDQTLPQVKADLIYKGTLSNKGENLYLLDPKGKVIDKILAKGGWPGGDKKSFKTLQRNLKTLEWQTSILPGGSPKAPNRILEKPKFKTITKDKLQALTLIKILKLLTLPLLISFIFSLVFLYLAFYNNSARKLWQDTANGTI